MVNWYYALLIHRNLYTTYENSALEVTTNMGFTQGRVSGAKFWIIAFDEAAKILNSNGVTRELFADDGNGLIRGQGHRLHGSKTEQGVQRPISMEKNKD